MPIFEVIGSSDPLGLWDTTPQAVSFGAEGENTSGPVEPVYRVNFTDNLEVANDTLAENLASFKRMKAALHQVPPQLKGLVHRVQEKQLRKTSGPSFALAELQPESGPDGELLALLAIADSAAFGGTGPEGVSFGLISQASQVLRPAKEKFVSLLEQVNHEVLHFAWIEMKIAGKMIARTKVGWGASNTIWIDAISNEQMSLHMQTLKVVSLSRNLKLHLLLTVAIGAVKMAQLMVTPAAAQLAAPAVYDYVKKIVDQVKELRSVQSL
jgi:hypothetical protein